MSAILIKVQTKDAIKKNLAMLATKGFFFTSEIDNVSNSVTGYVGRHKHVNEIANLDCVSNLEILPKESNV